MLVNHAFTVLGDAARCRPLVVAETGTCPTLAVAHGRQLFLTPVELVQDRELTLAELAKPSDSVTTVTAPAKIDHVVWVPEPTLASTRKTLLTCDRDSLLLWEWDAGTMQPWTIRTTRLYDQFASESRVLGVSLLATGPADRRRLWVAVQFGTHVLCLALRGGPAAQVLLEAPSGAEITAVAALSSPPELALVAVGLSTREIAVFDLGRTSDQGSALLVHQTPILGAAPVACLCATSKVLVAATADGRVLLLDERLRDGAVGLPLLCGLRLPDDPSRSARALGMTVAATGKVCVGTSAGLVTVLVQALTAQALVPFEGLMPVMDLSAIHSDPRIILEAASFRAPQPDEPTALPGLATAVDWASEPLDSSLENEQRTRLLLVGSSLASTWHGLWVEPDVPKQPEKRVGSPRAAESLEELVSRLLPNFKAGHTPWDAHFVQDTLRTLSEAGICSIDALARAVAEFPPAGRSQMQPSAPLDRSADERLHGLWNRLAPGVALRLAEALSDQSPGENVQVSLWLDGSVAEAAAGADARSPFCRLAGGTIAKKPVASKLDKPITFRRTIRSSGYASAAKAAPTSALKKLAASAKSSQATLIGDEAPPEIDVDSERTAHTVHVGAAAVPAVMQESGDSGAVWLASLDGVLRRVGAPTVRQSVERGSTAEPVVSSWRGHNRGITHMDVGSTQVSGGSTVPLVATASADHTVRVWTPAQPHALVVIEPRNGGETHSVQFLARVPLLAVAVDARALVYRYTLDRSALSAHQNVGRSFKVTDAAEQRHTAHCELAISAPDAAKAFSALCAPSGPATPRTLIAATTAKTLGVFDLVTCSWQRTWQLGAEVSRDGTGTSSRAPHHLLAPEELGGCFLSVSVHEGIQMWDPRLADTRHPVLALAGGHVNRASRHIRCAFLGSHHVVCGSEDGVVPLYDVRAPPSSVARWAGVGVTASQPVLSVSSFLAPSRWAPFSGVLCGSVDGQVRLLR